jgi:hypothetical protein
VVVLAPASGSGIAMRIRSRAMERQNCMFGDRYLRLLIDIACVCAKVRERNMRRNGMTGIKKIERANTTWKVTSSFHP